MERRQSSEEEEEDSLSGKGCGPLFQSSREQLEPNHWLPRKYVDMRSNSSLLCSHFCSVKFQQIPFLSHFNSTKHIIDFSYHMICDMRHIQGGCKNFQMDR